MIALGVLAVVTPIHVHISPQLDGRLDDLAWAGVPAFTSFVQKDPDAGSDASEPTSVRVVYDEDALWVGIDCVQQRAPIVRRLTRRDREEASDRVEVDLDSRGTGRDAYLFQVNAAGVLVDALRYDDTELNTDWDENWEARVAITPTGWSAELRIPFRAMRYSREPGARWGFQVRRFISERAEIDELSPIPRGEAGETSRYGSLGPFGPLPDRAGLELRPFVLAAIERSTDGTVTRRSSIGGELKWHLTPTLTLDATVNPDFTQVEADQQVLNLSTYETYYPEKRPFFFEGAQLFAAPLQVLYTRRIGQVPGEPALPEGEEVRPPVLPSPVWGAAKLIGTVGDDTQVGALAAVTGANRVTTDAADITHDRIADPWTAYGALRMRRGLGKRGYLGMFATAVARFEELDYPIEGTQVLCPDRTHAAVGARCTHDALVAGVDGRWRSASGAYVLEGDLAASLIRGGPARLQPDGVVIASGDVSPQASVTAAREANGPVFDVTLEAYGRSFDINDAGYLKRANFVHADVNAGWKDTTPGRYVRESTTKLGFSERRNWRDERIGGNYSLETSLVLTSYWRLGLELQWKPAYFDDREVHDGTALERARRAESDLSIASDPRDRVTWSWTQATSVVEHGLSFEGDGDLTLHALPRLDIELLPTTVIARGEPRYVATLDSGARLFGRQDAFAAGLTVRTTYTFSPRATLQLYGALFGESVAYRDFTTAPTGASEVQLRDLSPTTAPAANTNQSSTVVNASAVFRWEWRLGSTLYLVYSRAQEADQVFASLHAAPVGWIDGLAAASSQVVLAKLSYWW